MAATGLNVAAILALTPIYCDIGGAWAKVVSYAALSIAICMRRFPDGRMIAIVAAFTVLLLLMMVRTTDRVALAGGLFLVLMRCRC